MVHAPAAGQAGAAAASREAAPSAGRPGAGRLAASRHEHAIEVDGLVREFKKGPRAVDGIELVGRPRRDLRLPRPERRRQVDDRADADDAAAADRRARRASAASTSSTQGPEVRKVIGAALQEAALDPLLTGREHLRLQATLQALPRDERRAARRRAARARRPDRGGRPQGERLLGRDEAPARPGARARAPAADPLPRRADDRPRHPEPHGAVGRGAPAREGRGRDRLPHHAVPRGGRRPRRPRRDHRPRHGSSPRARRPRSRPRSAARPSRSSPADPADAERANAILAELRRAAASPSTASPSASAPGRPTSPGSCARSTREGIAVEQLQLHQPSLDDVFLAKTGRSLEGAGDDATRRSERIGGLAMEAAA